VAEVPAKSAAAFRTIGEVSRELGVAQHILRYWETRFPQLKPLQRAGGRRYYRPEDVALVRRIDALLREEGYTIAGVLKLFAAEAKARRPVPEPSIEMIEAARLIPIREALAGALETDG
jgi:DNA-binding transcriptional MerR regulator